MTIPFKSPEPQVISCISWGKAAGWGFWALLSVFGFWQFNISWPHLQLMPMIGALDNCLLAKDSAASIKPCGGKPDTAERLIEFTLQALGPRTSQDGLFQVGYTLNVPLLRMFKKDDQGQWQFDVAAAKRIAQTIEGIDRPVVLYLFSTHFEVGGGLELELFGDPSNLAQTPDGPLPVDKYYHLKIFPWSVSRVDNSLTHYRKQAVDAVLSEVCKLSPLARTRVTGVTVLGEVHQLFPGFESGMGFASAYRVTDYSEVSKAGFHAFLAEQFGNVRVLNTVLAADYLRFEDVQPPSLDIRKDKLTRFHDHIDAYAAGVLPVSGWVHVEDGKTETNWIRVYLNGQEVGRVSARYGRQDVLAAKPELGTADVGWRHDIDFSDFSPGLYEIDVVLERGALPLKHLASRTVAVVDRAQNKPVSATGTAVLPNWGKPGPDTSYFVDTPGNLLSVYFNPLVPLWHQFRERQVTQYLNHVAEVAKKSCLGAERVFAHQIVPFVNPSWDSSRFAIADSLKPDSGLALGISLYGEPIYGDSALPWIKQRAYPKKYAPYGLTEFHPLKAMDANELREVLLMHRKSGARFVSFFAEPRWEGERIEEGMNLFSLDPENEKFASDVLYRSFSTLLKQH